MRRHVSFSSGPVFGGRLYIAVLTAWTATAMAQTDGASGPAKRPAAWAQPIALPGLPNLHRIDDGLYRSAQPSAEGMAQAVKLGIKTVINLRALHDDADEVGSLPLARVDVPLWTWDISEDQVIQVLRVAIDPARRPVLIHCQHGADRTGLMSAAYRVTVQGWTKQAALDELLNGGYGYHSVWSNIPPLLERLDVPRIRAFLGLRP